MAAYDTLVNGTPGCPLGGRPTALDAHGVEMARALYEMKGDDGKRRYTVQQIADRNLERSRKRQG